MISFKVKKAIYVAIFADLVMGLVLMFRAKTFGSISDISEYLDGDLVI